MEINQSVTLKQYYYGSIMNERLCLCILPLELHLSHYMVVLTIKIQTIEANIFKLFF